MEVAQVKQSTEDLRTRLASARFDRSMKLEKMARVMSDLSTHSRRYCTGEFEFQPGPNIHFQTLCEMVAVNVQADHLQLYIAHHDLEPEVSLAYQTR